MSDRNLFTYIASSISDRLIVFTCLLGFHITTRFPHRPSLFRTLIDALLFSRIICVLRVPTRAIPCILSIHMLYISAHTAHTTNLSITKRTYYAYCSIHYSIAYHFMTHDPSLSSSGERVNGSNRRYCCQYRFTFTLTSLPLSLFPPSC